MNVKVLIKERYGNNKALGRKRDKRIRKMFRTSGAYDFLEAPNKQHRRGIF